MQLNSLKLEKEKCVLKQRKIEAARARRRNS